MEKRFTLIAVLTAVLTTMLTGVAAASAEVCQGWMMGPDTAVMPNPGFEEVPTTTQRVDDWCTEGPDYLGVDREVGWARSGKNNAYIVAWSDSRWNALSQHLVVPNARTIEVSAYVATTPNIVSSYLIIRDRATGAEYARRWIGALGGRQANGSVIYERTAVLFRPNQPVSPGTLVQYTASIGYLTPGGASEMLIDDFAIRVL